MSTLSDSCTSAAAAHPRRHDRAARTRLPAALPSSPGRLPGRTDGSLVEVDGKVVGSSLLAQGFDAAEYFWPRPSAGAATTRSPPVGPTSAPTARTDPGHRGAPGGCGRANGVPRDQVPPMRSPPRLRARPAHLPGVRGPAGRPRGPGAGCLGGRRCGTLVAEHTSGRGARVPRRAGGQRPGASTWRSTLSRADERQTGRPCGDHRRGTLRVYIGAAPRGGQDLRHARRGPPPRSTAGPTWSSASSRPTAGRTPPRWSRAWRWSPGGDRAPRGHLHRDGPRRGAGPTPAGGPGR